AAGLTRHRMHVVAAGYSREGEPAMLPRCKPAVVEHGKGGWDADARGQRACPGYGGLAAGIAHAETRRPQPPRCRAGRGIAGRNRRADRLARYGLRGRVVEVTLILPGRRPPPARPHPTLPRER